METIQLERDNYELVVKHLKERFFKGDYLREYFIDEATITKEGVVIDKTYEQVDILDDAFCIEYNIKVTFQWMENRNEWMVVYKDVNFLTLFQGDDEIVGLTNLQKNRIQGVLINLIKVTI